MEPARRRGEGPARIQTLKEWRDTGMRLLLYYYDFGLIMSGGVAALILRA